MNDGAAVLLSGYTSEIPPPRRVLGFRSGKRAGYALKLRANTRHSAEQASRRRLRLLLLLQMDTRTDGWAQVRRPGSALSWAVRGQRRGLGSQTLQGLDQSAAPIYSWLFPAHDRCKNVHAGPSAALKMCLRLHPETDKVVMDLSQFLNADTPSGSDNCAPVSVSPLTIANQDSRTQKWASAK